MRDQYAGDVSDVLKFAFLRALARTDRTLGIAWYYVPDNDGRPDGRHLEWRDELAWQRLDQQLHTGLSMLHERSIGALERAAIWPKGTRFHREPMPISPMRNGWGMQMRRELDVSDILFLDPDNGLGKESPKHATLSEIRLLRKAGRAIVFITFPGRSKPHEVLVQQLHNQLLGEAGAGSVITLRTNVSVPYIRRAGLYVQRQRWFTVVDPDAELTARAREFVDSLTSIPRVRAKLDLAP